MAQHRSGIDEHSRLAIYLAQKAVFEHALLDDSLGRTMAVLCQRIELLLASEGAVCSILLLSDGCLQHCAAPHLAKEYCDAIDGLAIGEGVGSCGTALFRKQQVIVADIAHDTLWQDHAELALSFGLQACWSTPVFDKDNEALASFAVYYPRPFLPSQFHLELIDEFCALAQLVITHHQLISSQNSLADQVRDTSLRMAAIMAVVPDVGVVMDRRGKILELFGDVSLLGQPAQALENQNVADVLGHELGDRVKAVLEKTALSGDTTVLEYEIKPGGKRRVFEARTALLETLSDAHGDACRIVCMARDITARKEAEEEAATLAMFDTLTGLPNRRHLGEDLERLLEEVGRGIYLGAVVILDLDDFKRINDLLGHQKGDEVLKMVARRLKQAVHRSELVARLGGDEFVLVLREPVRESQCLADDITRTAERLVDCFEQPFSLASNQYKITPSIGIALIEHENALVDELLRCADAAMYAAKQAGGNRLRFYEPSLQEEAQRRLTLERNMVSALEQQDFCAWFQPQVNRMGQPMAAEALMRWRDSAGAYISPADFIPVAEHSGLIHALQEVVLEKSCELLVALRTKRALPEGFSVAINISPAQFGRSDLARRLTETLEKYDLEPELFMLEITENLLMEDQSDVHLEMQALRELGFRFSIDDFGTGYSSLSYLHRLPVDQLKIDGSFIADLGVSDVGEPIVDSIVALSNNLSFELVAEGVATQAQARLLQDKPIALLQGFFFARPMPPAEFIDYLAKQRSQ